MISLRKCLLTLAVAAGIAAPTRADFAVGLVGGTQLTTFDTATPGATTALVAITGLRPDETIVGIDFRPATPGVLVGVGSLGGSGMVYSIDYATGAATSINANAITLTGSAFGVDFNPVPNALRIVSDSGQNLRITAGGTGTVNSDTILSENGIVAAAYSNNVAGATTTTLYELSTASGSLVRQGGLNGPPSPNLGAITTIGALGVDFTNAGFDISGNSGAAFAVLAGRTGAGLYTVDVATGQASLVGDFGGVDVQDLAVQSVPAPTGVALFALGLAGAGLVRRRRAV